MAFWEGRKILRWKISNIVDEDRIGYYWGTHTITGVGEDHVCWVDDKPIVASPDIIVIADAETWEPVTNPMVTVGLNVRVLAFLSRTEFKSQKAIDILGLKYFGFDIKYCPIDETMEAASS